MRHIKNIGFGYLIQVLLVLSILFLIISCSKVRRDGPGESYFTELKLKSDYLAALLKASPLTKTLENLPLNTRLGVFLTEKDIPLTITGNYFNVEKVVNADGSLTGNPVMMVIGKSYDIYSYAPFHPQSKASPVVESFAHGEDVIWGGKKSIVVASESNNTVNLEFDHVVSQISFDVRALNPGYVFPVNAYIKVYGFFPVAQLDVSTGLLTPTDVTSHYTTGLASNGILELKPFCFFNNGNNNLVLNLEVFDGNKTYHGTINKIFNSGQSYKFNVTIPGTQPELIINATLTSWIEMEGEITIGN